MHKVLTKGMVRRVSQLLGFMAAVVTVTKARNVSVPQYAVKQTEASAALDVPSSKLKQDTTQSNYIQLSVLEQELKRPLGPPRFSASIARRTSG